MIEILPIILFLCIVYIVGKTALCVLKTEHPHIHWLSAPLGWAITAIVWNCLYYRLGFTIQQIQVFTLICTGLCIAFLIYRKTLFVESKSLLGLLLTFGFLCLPLFIGGEQYFVLRGNHWDHFGYLNIILAMWSNPLSFYQSINLPAVFADYPLFRYGIGLLNQGRPGVAGACMLLPGGYGNFHLLGALIPTAFWALAYPALQFAWNEFMAVVSTRQSSFLLRVLPPLACVIGFWGQYVYDINAWGHLAGGSLFIALFAVVGLIFKDATAPSTTSRNRFSLFLCFSFIAAAALQLYPESAVIAIFCVGLGYLIASIVTRQMPSRRIIGYFFGSFILIVLLCFPFWQILERFIVHQITFASSAKIEWWKYFDSYWLGIASAPRKILRVLNFPPSLVGLYFVTPDYSLDAVQLLPWCVIFLALAALVAWALLSICRINLYIPDPLEISGSRSQSPMRAAKVMANTDRNSCAPRYISSPFIVFWQAAILAALIPIAYLTVKKEIWPLGKLFSYMGMVTILFLLIPIRGKEIFRGKSLIFTRPLYYVAVILCFGHLYFGGYRLVSALDKNGIGYNPAHYPSIQSANNKIHLRWDLDISGLSHDDVAHLNIVERIPFIYAAQKLTYAGVTFCYEKPLADEALPEYPGMPVRFDVTHNISIIADEQGRRFAVSSDPGWLIKAEGVESYGYWTIDKDVRLYIKPHKDSLGKRMRIEIPIVRFFEQQQRVQPVVNGRRLPEILANDDNKLLSFEIDDDISATGRIEIALSFPDAKSPKELGLSEDPRLLAIGFKDIIIECIP